MAAIETDYLVIGAGAAGMAFTDALIADSEADVVMVDRRHGPGGHWHDAYPFVRLHQASAYYGVNSRVLGHDSIDETGLNAGFYERATAPQICDYYEKVMSEHLLRSGQVRFFAMSDYLGLESGDCVFVSSLTGATTNVRVRRKVVDARYLEPTVPSTHTPSFEVDAEAQLIPVNELVKRVEAGSGYTIIGGGKTAMDACTWLLEGGVDPSRIRWIRPRDSWVLDRAYFQPLALVTGLIEGFSLAAEAGAQASSLEDLFARLEASGQIMRLDPTVKPTMFHSATLSVAELELLRSIENVVRRGYVRHVGADEITMDHGTIPTDRRKLHVDCSAAGLRKSPARPIFETDRITLQPIRTVVPPFNAAFTAYVEATRDHDEEKSLLCPTNRYPETDVDWLPNMYVTLESLGRWNQHADVTDWLERSRLNISRGMFDHAHETRMSEAITRLLTYTEPAINNLKNLHATVA
jgi:hypothetical protein